MNRQFTCGLIALAALALCCAKQQPRQVYEAVASLRKVQAATQVGVNYQQYGELLIEAKDKANAASRVLSDGPIKAEIQAAMDACDDAGDVWGLKLKSSPPFEVNRSLLSKYSLKSNLYGELTDADESIRTIWQNADLHLNKLAELLPTS